MWIIRYLDRYEGKTDARVFIYPEYTPALKKFREITEKWLSLEHPSIVGRLIEEKRRRLADIGSYISEEYALEIIREYVIGCHMFASVTEGDSLVFSLQEYDGLPLEIRMDYENDGAAGERN